MPTMLFNPYTGLPRHPADIASDPAGLLMIDPDAPLVAAKAPPAEDAALLAKIREAITGYHLELDSRLHGGVAMDRAFNSITTLLGMPWVQGAALAARRAAQGGPAHG